MPWQESTAMSDRQEFLGFAQQEGANLSELCRRYGISRKTAYKWLGRLRPGPEPDFADHSRRPQAAPSRTSPAIATAVLAVREAQPTWGARKLRQVLARQDLPQAVPAASTITAILRRHDRLSPSVRETRD